MSSFTKAPRPELIGDYKFTIVESFDFHVGEYPSEEIITVPEGFRTDLASVPRVLWSIFPPHGPWANAAVIHDYLYQTGYKTKKYADRVFLEAMTVLKVPKTTRTLMYWAVRIFGKGNYK